MTTVIGNPLTQMLGLTLVHFVWQGALVALAVVLALRLLKPGSPNARYLIASLGLGLMLVFPIATFASLSLQRPGADPADTAALSNEAGQRIGPAAQNAADREAIEVPGANAGDEKVSELPTLPGLGSGTASVAVQRALPWVAFLWAVGVVLLSLRALGGWAYTLRLRRDGTRAPPAAWQEGLRRAARGIRRPIQLFISELVDSPVAVGWLRPAILFPVGAVSGLSMPQVEAILHHEIAHIRRHDHLVAILQIVTETLLFYHPGVWWLSGLIRSEREMCCDDAAVAASGDPAGYAWALAQLEEIRSTPAGALAAADGPLLRRIRRVLGADRCIAEAETSFPALAVIAAGLVLAFALGLAPSQASASRDTPGLTPAAGPAGSEASAAALAAQQVAVIRAPDMEAPLSERWAWAMDSSRRQAAGSAFWVAWGIRRPGFENAGVTSNVGGGPRYEPASYPGELLRPPSRDARGPDAYFLFGFAPGGDEVGDIRWMRMRGPKEPVALSDRPVFWLGAADDAESVEQFQKLYSATDWMALRAEIGAALALHVDASASMPAIERILTEEPDADVRGETASWLGYQDYPRTVELLLKLARNDPSRRVRDEAVTGLRGMRVPEAQLALMELAESSDHADVRSEAIQSLGRAGQNDAVPALERIVHEDENPDVQMEAVDALRNIATPDAMESLRRIAESHSSWDIRSEAAQWVARLGG